MSKSLGRIAYEARVNAPEYGPDAPQTRDWDGGGVTPEEKHEYEMVADAMVYAIHQGQDPVEVGFIVAWRDCSFEERERSWKDEYLRESYARMADAVRAAVQQQPALVGQDHHKAWDALMEVHEAEGEYCREHPSTIAFGTHLLMELGYDVLSKNHERVEATAVVLTRHRLKDAREKVDALQRRLQRLRTGLDALDTALTAQGEENP